MRLLKQSAPIVLTLICFLSATNAQLKLGGGAVASSGIHTASYATLADLLTAVGSTPTYVIVDSVVSVSASTEIPATITLQVVAPGQFSFSNSAVLTIDGTLTADPLYQVFSGTGSVAFACGGTSVVSPGWWGLDSVTNITRGLQAAVDSLPTCGGSIKIPSTPALGWDLTKPIRINRSHVDVEGTGNRDTSLINATMAAGPAFLVAADSPGIPTETALATGTGSAFTLSAGNAFDLSDFGACELNGLAAFSAETFVKFSAFTEGGVYYLLSSRGRELDSESAIGAFEVELDTTGGAGTEKIVGKLRVGSSYKVVTGTTIVSTATVYHVAMTYDGSNVRLFVNGHLEATTAATGTVTQRATEDVKLGSPTLLWPDVPDFETAASGAVDSVRLSNNARYTSGFTAPTAKFTSESNTLVLMNFDEQTGQLTKAYSANQVGYLAMRRNSGASFITKVNIRNLQINGKIEASGIFAFSANTCNFEDLDIEFTRIGLYQYSSSFLNHITNYRGLAGPHTRFMLAHGLSSGLNYYEHLDITGGIVPFVGTTGSLVVSNAYLSLDDRSIYGAFFRAADDTTVTLINTNITNEGGTPVNLKAGIGISQVLTTTIVGGTIFVGTNNTPAINHFATGQTQLTVTGTNFEISAAATEHFNLTGVTSTLTLVGPYTFTPAVPWTITGQGSTTVVGRGTQYPNRTVSSSYPVTLSDHTIRANATGGAFPVTLLSAVGIAGRTYTIKKTDSSGNAVTVATTSAQTIDGQPTYPLSSQYSTVTVESDGANWIIVGKF